MNRYYWAWHNTLRVAAPLLTNIEVRGADLIPRTGALIVVGNHLSMADPPLLMAYVKRHIHFMIKRELLHNLIFRLIMPPGGPVPVNRGKADREALKQAETILKNGGVMGIYPEGTRSRTGVAQEAHAGVVFLAQRTGAPIQPVAIAGSERIFPGKFPWYRRARVQLMFGQPFTLADLQTGQRPDRGALARLVMERIVALLPPRYRGRYLVSSAHPAEPEHVET